MSIESQMDDFWSSFLTKEFVGLSVERQVWELASRVAGSLKTLAAEVDKLRSHIEIEDDDPGDETLTEEMAPWIDEEEHDGE
jgi:hypothetical protein